MKKIISETINNDNDILFSKKIQRKILLNPGPATTSDSVKYAMLTEDICPREKEFGDLIKSVRTDLVKIVHGDSNYTSVLFTCSGTGAIEACITSVVPENKKILVIENGAYGKRITEICDAFKIDYIHYFVEWGKPLNENDILKLIEENKDVLSHIALIHHETTTGILNPLEKIVSCCNELKIEVILDAMSSFAGLPLDLRENKIDFVISSSNKCIQGMAGISFVICNKESIMKTKDFKVRNYYFNLYRNYKYQEENNQSLFTPPVQIFYALRQAINEYFLETEEGRFSRYDNMYKTLKFGLKNLGFEFLVDEKHHARLLTTVFEPTNPSFNFEHLHDFFYDRGFTLYPGKVSSHKTFRISNIGQIYEKDILDFLELLEIYLKEYV